MSKPPDDSDEIDDLIRGLEELDSDTLSNAAAQAEGLNGQPAVIPGYHHRHIKFYHITEHELSAVSLVNAYATTLFSVGTAFIAFAIDIFKDTALAEAVPLTAQNAIEYAQPLLWGFGIFFWVAGAASMVWRWNFVRKIKRESLKADRFRPYRF